MIYGRQYVGNWLQHAHAVSKRYQDPGLSALLVVQLVLIFVVEPLASQGVAPPLTATGIVIVGLILLLVVGAQKLGVKLPRFRGHRSIYVRGVHDVEVKRSLRPRVPPPTG